VKTGELRHSARLSTPPADRSNELVADKLREAAALLEQQNANPFRVRAYRHAADTLAELGRDVREIVAREGPKGLTALPGIGAGIAAAIEEMLRTGRWSQLDRLRGTLEPDRLFQGIPGIGVALATRIHDALHVDTLEALEIAAHDGRLASVPGMGPRRAAMIRSALAGMLGRASRRAAPPAEEPSVEMLLDVDRQYRKEAEAGGLPLIAPRRFNPRGEAWLAVLHTERGKWHFTALFSNTARAHELGRTRDWVVIYFHGDSHPEGQRTVVTETRGSLASRRVVRGRESECLAHYGETRVTALA
jgi:DNA polymerase (family X)